MHSCKIVSGGKCDCKVLDCNKTGIYICRPVGGATLPYIGIVDGMGGNEKRAVTALGIPW